MSQNTQQDGLDRFNPWDFPRYTFSPDEDTKTPQCSFDAQREFFDRLEMELRGAWQAGYNCLTVIGPSNDELYRTIVVDARFVPHNCPDRFNGVDSQLGPTEKCVTYPVEVLHSESEDES